MLRQMAVLGSLSSLLAVALIVLAPRGAAWVLGEDYATVGVVAAILAVPFALQLTAAPLAPFLIMVDRQAALFRLAGGAGRGRAAHRRGHDAAQWRFPPDVSGLRRGCKAPPTPRAWWGCSARRAATTRYRFTADRQRSAPGG